MRRSVGYGLGFLAGTLAGVAGRLLAPRITRPSRRHDAPPPAFPLDPHPGRALAMGLLSSTYSTAVITAGAGRIGRDPALDWMEVGTAYFGRRLIRREPGLPQYAAGIFVHQSADVLWALAWFGGLGRWTRRLSPNATAALGVPWALLTASIEYHLVLPWLQPWLTMQVPFWTAATVHLSSAAAYTLHPLLDEDAPADHRRSALVWAAALGVGLLALASTAARSRLATEPRPVLGDLEPGTPGARFLRHMTAHHVVGLRLARAAADRARNPELRRLGDLMLAEHEAELRLMRHWWRSWVGGDIPGLEPDERRAMPGMPPDELVERVETVPEPEFDRLFLTVMIRHHEGAIAMCRDVREDGGPPRVRLMARSIRHAQERQIQRMSEILAHEHRDRAATVPYSW